MNDLIVPAPEWLEVANIYVRTASIEETAAALRLPAHSVATILAKRETREYLQEIYLDMGYRNRSKLGALLDKMIDAKIEEAAETGVYTNKDLADLIAMAHKMRMDEIKATPAPVAPTNQTNVQINDASGKTGYMQMVERLWKSQG